MTKYLDFFDEVYYINLDHRTDRNTSFLEKAERVGIHNPTRVSGVLLSDDDVQDNMYNEPNRKFKVGCSMSHQKVIQTAVEKNQENILVFEDDCVFLENFESEMKKCVQELVTLDWDMIYFGGEPSNYCKPITENLYINDDGGFYCLHAYGVNRRFFKSILEYDPHQIGILDIQLMHHSVDHRTYIASKELLATQEEYMFSELEQHDLKNATPAMTRGWSKYVTNSIHNR